MTVKKQLYASDTEERYFAIVTFEKMTAKKAFELDKSRDASEKLFKGDKSYL